MDWEWFHDSNMVHLWIYFLIKANRTDTNWQGVDIPRGSFVTTLNGICKDTGLSMQNVRTCIKKLVANKKLTHEVTNGLTNKVTNKFTIITICEYDSYNTLKNGTNKETNKQANTPSNNKLTNDKEKVPPIPPLKEYKQEIKTPPIIPPRGYGDIDFSFIESNYIKPFFDWLKYKSERGVKYKSEMSIKTAYNRLVKLSNGNAVDAIAIVEQSIANNWQGLFELKDNSNKNKSGMSVGVILNERPKYTEGW